MAFLNNIIKGDGGEVRYIIGFEFGKPAWYFLRLFPERFHEYKRSIQKHSIALTSYGEILASGWGEHAPKHIIEEMKLRYGLKNLI